MSDYTGPGVYRLHPEHAPSTVAHLPGPNNANGTQATIWTASVTADHLKWVIAYAGQEEYFILNYATGGYLTSEAGGKNDGKITVNLIAPSDKRARWKIVPARTGTGSYYIESVDSPGVVLHVPGAATANNSAMTQWAKSANQAHLRFFIRLP
ncbi:hypothetical protein D9757_008429 [Collybiopsis confluens]|uniref:Ricin B lectin domain-containing protein n=1 Tax=Collybiopsis confluens TaxID=2823264 RepID=A0A8H5HH94_9AGAR|nr:hypothetical protein D9757_011231 [Collybiopsis confluens]KAF5383322.1 hypothetical protein D9757_008429 [Collybiopsis confluens]